MLKNEFTPKKQKLLDLINDSPIKEPGDIQNYRNYIDKTEKREIMDDPEIHQIFEKFLQNPNLTDETKLRKLKRIVIEFSNRWAEERTLTSVRW